MSRRAGLLLVAFVVAVIAVLTGAVAVVLIEDDAVDAPELLARATAFVEEQQTVHFDGTFAVRFSDPDSAETVSSRTRVEGETDFEDSRLTAVQGGFYTEVRAVGRTVYERSADSERGLRRERFAEYDLDASARRAGIVGPTGSDPAELGEPATLPELLRRAQNPRLLDAHGERVRLAADVGEEVFERFDTSGDATIVLVMDPDGRVHEARIRVEADGAVVRSEYALRGWGEPVEIERPSPSEIDPTPGIDEEDLAEWDLAPLLSPRVLPRGWVLEAAYVVPEEETAEECEQVAIDYTDPDDPEAGYLYFFQIPVECEGLDIDPPRGATPFAAGRYQGWIDEDEGGLLAQVVVGETAVQVDTDLDAASVMLVLASLGPLDFEAPTTTIPARTQAA